MSLPLGRQRVVLELIEHDARTLKLLAAAAGTSMNALITRWIRAAGTVTYEATGPLTIRVTAPPRRKRRRVRLLP